MTDEEKRELDKKRNDLKWVVSTPQGRRFYWRVMSECKSFKIAFIPDPYQTNYINGRKSVGLDLYHDLLDAEPNAFVTMQNENKAQDTRKDLKVKRDVRDKLSNPTKIDSPSLPNTGREKSDGGKDG